MKAFLDRPLFTGSAFLMALLICLILDGPAIFAALKRRLMPKGGTC